MTIPVTWSHAVGNYGPKDALEDGRLIDLTEYAREAGITWPVYIARAAYDLLIDARYNERGEEVCRTLCGHIAHQARYYAATGLDLGRALRIVYATKNSRYGSPVTLYAGLRPAETFMGAGESHIIIYGREGRP